MLRTGQQNYAFDNAFALIEGHPPYSVRSVMLFGRGLFRNNKRDRALVESVMVRVLQFKERFVPQRSLRTTR